MNTKILALAFLAVSAFAQVSPSRTESRDYNGNGEPGTGCKGKSDVGKRFYNLVAGATNSTQFNCSNTSAGVYQWELVGSGGGGGIDSGPTLPATCDVGEVFFDTDGTPGQNIYGCTAPNTWVPQAGGTPGVNRHDVTFVAATSGSTPASTHLNGTKPTIQCFYASGIVTDCGNSVINLTTGNITWDFPSDFTGIGRVTGGGAGAQGIQGDPGSTGPISDRPLALAVGDPAGGTLTTGVLGYLVSSIACTINSWDIVVDGGTATVDIWKIATGTAKPTIANTIVASAKPAISTGTAIHSTTLTSWTTSVAVNDIFGFNLEAASGVKFIYVGVKCN